jgi:tripartite ATP-independent transporter DctP family solute receptor
MRPLRRRSFLAGSLTAALLAPHVARAALRVAKLASGVPAKSPAGVCADSFAAAVAADPELSAVLRIEVHQDAALGNDLTTLRGCIDGAIDLAVVGTTVANSIVPEIGVLDIPFLFRSVAAARAALDGPPRQDLIELLQGKGIYLLAWLENGIRHITANKPIRKPSDLAGLKLRVPPSEVVIGAFLAMGAAAEPLPFPEVYAALGNGAFEAQENPLGLIETAKFYEVQKVLSLTGHAYSAGLVVASPDLLEDLTASQRAALKDCATIAQNASRAAADVAQRLGVDSLAARGMTVVRDVDVVAFHAANLPYLESLANKFGRDRLARLQQADG